MAIRRSGPPTLRDDCGETTNTTQVGVGPRSYREVDATVRDRPYFVAISGTNAGQIHKLADGLIIGRGSRAGIPVDDDEGVSRRHARIEIERSVVVIEDLGSVNGTFVNGDQVTKKTLEEGDKIRVGTNTIFKFIRLDKQEESFQRQLSDAALRDPLTQVFNKGYLTQRLDAEVAYSQRHGTPLAIVLFDVDHFKRVNDEKGHPAGDAVLGALARLVERTIRVEDVLARYGGEEFVVICRGLTLEKARAFAERLRATVAGHAFYLGSERLLITISAGVADYRPTPDANTSVTLFAKADAALLRAKRGGRNQIEVAP